MTEPDQASTISTIGAVEDLARRALAGALPESYSLDHDSQVIARVVRTDERLDVRNLEAWLDEPERPRGAATIYDPVDFTKYVQRLADGWTTVWGNEENASFTAVFNDHLNSEEPGWRDHTATLQLKDDPEWATFLRHNGRYFNQIEFAEFLQDYRTLFVQPDGATLLEIATSFKAHRKADFSSEVNLDTDDVTFSYSEVTVHKTNLAGQIDVPSEFTVALSPFLGMPPVPILARLKWNVENNGTLQIGFRLQRPDLVKREAFAGIRQTIVDGLEDTPRGGAITVLLGAAPPKVAPV